MWVWYLLKMALRRKFKSRRRQSKRKYSSRRKSRTMARRTPKGYMIMKRKAIYSFEIGNQVTYSNINFTIGTVNTGSELSAMFDLYKISRIKVRFHKVCMPTQGMTTGVPGAISFPTVPRAYACIDYNDDDIPTSALALREYGNCKVWHVDRDQTFYFKPKVNLDVERNTNQPTPALASSPKWFKFDNNGASVRHRGLKFVIEQLVAPNGTYWAPGFGPNMEYEVTYYIKLKNVK